ncbi:MULTISPECIES: hypothetical protein [unclassified Erwinia]|uniref:hypothetical protein n=1 Tax=unclassified Erwinia TaxID=2622719 RepID=UPI001177A8E9|nr:MULTISPECIES: hypothetical protein [unclassified Erwinia]
MRMLNIYPDSYIVNSNPREISIISHGLRGMVIIDRKLLNPPRFYQYLSRWMPLRDISCVRIIACESANNVSNKTYWNIGNKSFGEALSSIMRNAVIECYLDTVRSECDPELLWPVYQTLGLQGTEKIIQHLFTNGVFNDPNNQPVIYVNGRQQSQRP